MQYNGRGVKKLQEKFYSMQEAALAVCEGSKQKLLLDLGHRRRSGLHLPQILQRSAAQCKDFCTEHPRKERRML